MKAQETPTPSAPRLATSLFLSFFTVQAAFIVLAPTLPDIAREFDKTVGGVGQLRTVAAASGVVTAIALAPLTRRLAVRALLLGGLAVLAAGGLFSAVAHTFALLALGQAVVGAGAAAVLSAGLAAASDWPAAGDRNRVLAWTIVGQPAAWVVGLPIVGALSHLGWRWSWSVVPTAALLAAVSLPGRCGSAPRLIRPRDTWRAWRDRRTRRWAFGELMAYAGWGGTLVYAGALLSESYGLGTRTVSLLLGAAAIAYFPGTFGARRALDGNLARLLAPLALTLAVGAATFGAVRPGVGVSVGAFALLVLLSGARTITGSAAGLRPLPNHAVSVGAMRSVAMQLGYLLGAGAGGLAVDAGGYTALGLVLGAFFGLAALPHLALGRPRPRYTARWSSG